jgi:hypothetical protein
VSVIFDTRLLEIVAQLAAIPKGAPHPGLIHKWRELLIEQEQLKEKLKGSVPI